MICSCPMTDIKANASATSTPPLYASLGSLIIDDIVYQNGTEERNVLGGAGIYAIYGMRVWLNPPESEKIGYIAQEGYDHPPAVADQLEKLDITLRRQQHADLHTTRGLNTFGPNDHRDFEYIHPIIRLTAQDPPDDWVHSLRVMHIICSPERAIEIVTEWRERGGSSTAFIWEPVPWSCLSERYEMVCKAAKLVDVLTPNHEEAAAMLGNSTLDPETCAQRLYYATQTNIVIRAGKQGAVVVTDNVLEWVPAYWKEQDSDKIQDVTGAGNAFCGGMCIGWVASNGNAVIAARYGAISASYIVEQVGLPTYERDNYEWNQGPCAQERLSSLLLLKN
ncbi:Ribokinase-like protein [Zychaea mexicana]|uniref:Ribokinase-like protein n=1 Tax=Zychaea mexicana TaxID=64656 RepID=UPI0022FE23CB|nr:Ribokinase-like protein [Zychaea mexicana]KAI9492466.1 Ribokinase-like protein [Zychaea mexicana]